MSSFEDEPSIHSSTREQQKATVPKEVRGAHVKRRKEFDTIRRETTLPQLNPGPMQRVKGGLSNMFKSERNRMLERMVPETDDSEEWLSFEGAYDESMRRIHEHIIRVIGRNPRRLYGERRLNPAPQAATEASEQTIGDLQRIRRD
jgi:hypothetical protein